MNREEFNALAAWWAEFSGDPFAPDDDVEIEVIAEIVKMEDIAGNEEEILVELPEVAFEGAINSGNTKLVSMNREESDEVGVESGKLADVTFASDGGGEKAKRSRNYLHQNMTDK